MMIASVHMHRVMNQAITKKLTSLSSTPCLTEGFLALILALVSTPV